MGKRKLSILVVLLLSIASCAFRPAVRHYVHDSTEYYSGTYTVPQGNGVHTDHDAAYVAKHTLISGLPKRLKRGLFASTRSLTAQQQDALLASVITAVPERYSESYLKPVYRVHVSLDVEAAGSVLNRMLSEIHILTDQHRSSGESPVNYSNHFMKDESVYNEFLSSDPGPFTALYLSALQHEYTKYYRDPNPFFAELMEHDPGFVYPYFYRARTLIASESPDAGETVEQLLGIRPEMAQAHYFKGLLLLKDKEYQPAIDSLTRAISLDDGLIEAYYHRGISYVRSEQYEPAIIDLTRVIETEIYEKMALYHRARAYYETGRFAEAIQDLDMYDVLRYSYALDIFRNAHLALGNYRFLIDHYTGFIEDDPDNAYYFSRRGEAYYLAGEFEKAISDFESYIPKSQYHGYALLVSFNSAAKLSEQHRQRSASELRAYIESRERLDFSGLIMKHYLEPDSTDEDHVLHMVDISFGSTDKHQCYLCKTYYYFGERHLNSGDLAGAKDFFQKALGAGRCCRESFLAQGMLRRLDENRSPKP